jgi:thiamine kinase-like enzyme
LRLLARNTVTRPAYVIDWEYAHYGRRAYDLGQMIGDLYERKHFKGADRTLQAINGFIDGYGLIDDDLAFRTAIHAGIHMIGWDTRRNSNSPLPASLEQVEELFQFATELIVKGWEKG